MTPEQLEAELEQVYRVLERLVDEQNGPPLERYKESWKEVMVDALRLINDRRIRQQAKAKER